MARSEGRVIITLDRDFAEYFHRTSRPLIGIVYLDVGGDGLTEPLHGWQSYDELRINFVSGRPAFWIALRKLSRQLCMCFFSSA